jgi:hypothetical protein
MYIVIYLHETNINGTLGHSEGWEAFDKFIDARQRYIELLQDENLDSASICRPIVSTDYETIQNPAKNDQ